MTSQRAYGALVGVTLAGQLAAVGYEVTVAARFGTGGVADALALALMLALAVGNEVVTWISTLFVPHYIEARTRAGTAAAARFLRGSLSLVLAGTGAAMVLLMIWAGAFVALLVPDPEARASGTSLLRLFAPLLVLLPLATLLSGALQADRRFVAAGSRQLLWYGAALLAVLWLGGAIGASAVPIGMTVGLALFCLVLALRLGGAWVVGGVAESPGPRFRVVAVALLPLALASAANYANVSIERSIAARLPEGSLAALTYAFRLLSFPFNLFLLTAATMLLPPLAEQAARRDSAAMAALAGRAMRLALLVTVPLAALAIALAEPAIRILLERGAFTAASTTLTATAFAWYAPGIVGMAVVQVLLRAYQALQEIRRMVATGIAVVALNVALMLGLTALIGFRGLPLAASVSALLLFVVMLLALRPRLPELALRPIVASTARTAIAGLAALVMASKVRDLSPGDLGALVLGSGAGLVVYVLALAALAREDLRLAIEVVAPRLAGRA